MKYLNVALLSVLVLCFSQSVHASISHALVQTSPPGLPAGVVSWDLQVTITVGDDWTSTSLTGMTFGGGSFVNPHPLDTYSPGTNDADTWFESTGAGAPSFAVGPTILPNSISATWFDLANGGSGTFTIARILTLAGTEFSIEGASATVQGGPQLTPYYFKVPSPGAIALLGLAGRMRRRRR